MIRIIIFLTTLLIIERHFTGAIDNDNYKVELSVYYESKDTASRKFILRKLIPVMTMLHKHINIHLVPFGGARSVNQGLDGFLCRRGPSECLGNIVQDCTLNLMYNQSDVQKLQYVGCEMMTLSGARKSTHCIKKAGVSEEKVETCATSSYGVQLQLSSEYLTKLIHPKTKNRDKALPHIPVVTINGDIFNDLHDDLTTALCSVLRETKLCRQYYNELALKYIMKGYNKSNNVESILDNSQQFIRKKFVGYNTMQ